MIFKNRRTISVYNIFIYFFQSSIIKQSCKNSVYDNGYFSVKLTPTLNRESVSEGFPTASELLEEKN